MKKHKLFILIISIVIVVLVALTVLNYEKKPSESTEPDDTAPPGMVNVPGGLFTMGRTREEDGWNDELPTHSVIIEPFYIGKYQVTQSEYEAVMGYNPAKDYGVGDNYPVYYVNWYSTLKYCNLLSIKEGLTPVYSINNSTNPEDWGPVPKDFAPAWDNAYCYWDADGYRLPTEAEWEYAARGGKNTPDYIYSGSDDIKKVGWYKDNNSPEGVKPVGGKSPNGLGIYDMSGNLWEWCCDQYESTSYGDSLVYNSKGYRKLPLTNRYHYALRDKHYRVLRGGYWQGDAEFCRIVRRGWGSPCYAVYDVGFRICRRQTSGRFRVFPPTDYTDEA